MAQLKTSHKWIIAIVAILAILGIIYAIYKYNTKTSAPSGPKTDTTTSTNGLVNLIPGLGGIKSWLGGIFGGGNPKTTSNSGYTTVGNCVNGCDDGAPGKDCDGFLNPQC